jgi:hypothetical protein
VQVAAAREPLNNVHQHRTPSSGRHVAPCRIADCGARQPRLAALGFPPSRIETGTTAAGRWR